MSDFIAEFLNGQSDCEKGIPHESGKSKAYDRGYAEAYEHEQRQTEATKND